MISATESLSQSIDAFVVQSVRCDLADRIGLCQQCIESVGQHAFEWAEAAAHHKSGGSGGFSATEDLLSGPAVVLRQLQLTIQTLESIRRAGAPGLSQPPRRTETDQLQIHVVPTRGLFDSIVFNGISASVILKRGISSGEIHGTRVDVASEADFRRTVVVLGAGNVSAIPATDCLNKIMFEGYRVVLKLNPVNEYLGAIFDQAFESLIRRGLLMIVRGGADVGEMLVHHAAVNSVHITGATATHDAIVWGCDTEERMIRKERHDPKLQKSITSELGNVSPWIVVPGAYTERQLASQAEQIAASITNNASFNCLATKLIITSSRWPQRPQFLGLIQQFLNATPVRYAYYPGARQRFCEFVGRAPDNVPDGCLPWTLLIDQSPSQRPDLFEKESFVAVCAETNLDAESPESFLRAAVDFVNDRVSGTLCASITVSTAFRKLAQRELFDAVSRLRYGTVCLNQWSGLSYALVSTPWGAWPGSTLQNPQSGMGNVHNTYLLDAVEKTVLDGPLISFPKPVWFPSHRRALAVATNLVKLYGSPSLLRLPRLGLSAAFG
ncbi:MAG: aldehyde dehydrogenase family protein [Planctomycetota bacterium]